MKILKFNKFRFLNEHFGGIPQAQGGLSNPFGAGFGFAIDKGLSIYNNMSPDSPYQDDFTRAALLNKYVKDTMNLCLRGIDFSFKVDDLFVEDISQLKNFKILRIVENATQHLDVYISFEMKDDEFFGVYKDYNKNLQKPKLKCELFQDFRFQYINHDYKLKLENFFFNVLNKWFKPETGLWKNLKESNVLKNTYGQQVELPKNAIIEILDNSDAGIIELTYKKEKYTISNNDYFYFKYRFEKL